MKKILLLLISLMITLGMSTISYANEIKIKVNSQYLPDAQAVLMDGTTLLPVRSVGTAVGGTVDWKAETNTAYIIKGNNVVIISIGQKYISVNGVKKSISVPAQIINGRTYVPLRALGEALNCYVNWIGETKTVDIVELANNPSEYKAWYEVDENGKLYLKTNIDSRNWDGYSMRIYKEYNNKKFDHDGQGSIGDAVLYSSTSSGTWDEVGDIIDKTVVFIYKGSDTHMKVWENLDKSNSYSLSNLEKESKLLGDKFVVRLEIDTDIVTEKSNKEIILTDFSLTKSEDGTRETYIAKINGNIETKGEYGLLCHYQKDMKGPYKASHMFKENGILTYTRESEHFAYFSDATEGYFCITYGTFNVKPDGTIVCEKTQSNSITHNLK